MKTLASAAFALTAALALTASAQPSPPSAPLAKTTPKPEHACFWRRNITSFAANDEHTLYVRVNVSDVWRLDLFSDCLDLDWVHRVGLRSIGGFDPTICQGENPGVDVVVPEVGLGRMRCSVTNVRRLSPAEVATLPKAARP